MKTWRVTTETDLPPRGPDVQVCWDAQLGEPADLRQDWCAVLAGEYDQSVGGTVRGPGRPITDVLADTWRRNLVLWVTFPGPPAAGGSDPGGSGRRVEEPDRVRRAEFRLQSSGVGEESAAVVEAIRRDLSLGGGVQRFAFGSVPVFAVGDEHVVKLLPPSQRAYFTTEWEVLTRIDGRLPIPTPRPVAAGERGPWLYIVMTRLPGCSLAEAWPSIEPRERVGLVRQMGAALAGLHAIALDGSALPPLDWPRFMEAQRGSCRDRQLAGGLGAPWLDEVDGFLARWQPRDDGARALLHTEVMREHIVVGRQGGGWRLSGILDFEDALLGAPEYEWACAGLFLTCAEPGLLRALLEGYGAEADDELPMRIMAYVLLHRYSSLRWYLDRLPVPEVPGDLESLARRWFSPR